MKVIFLDIDNVLNVMPQGHDEYGAIFHPEFVNNLRYIVNNTKAFIVISSSWRHVGLKQIRDMWASRSLPGNVIDITGERLDLDCFSKQRGTEIQEWLDKHPEVTSYVILNDDADMLESQWDKFVMCSQNEHHPDYVDIGYGLTKQCAQKAVDILNA